MDTKTKTVVVAGGTGALGASVRGRSGDRRARDCDISQAGRI